MSGPAGRRSITLIKALVGLQVFLLVAMLLTPAASLAADQTDDPGASAPPSAEPLAEPSTEPTAQPTPEPTAEPTPDATPDPTPAPTPDPTSAPTATAPSPVVSPTIASDKEDYAPGELVTVSGTGWQPGELVRLIINDDAGSSWSRIVDVSANGDGNITDQFNLPDWFVAVYSVVANGSLSGLATTTFTDGNVQAGTGSGGPTVNLTYTQYAGVGCTGTITSGPTTVSIGAVTSGNLFSQNTGSFKLAVPASAGTSNFDQWTAQSNFSSTDNPLCFDAISGNRTFIANYVANTAPTISDIANQAINEDAATGAIAFTVGDNETAAGSLTVSGTSNNTTLVPNANILFGGSGASRTVTVTPAANQNGGATITVTVSDGTLTASDQFVLTVRPINDTPTSAATSTSVAEDGSVGIDLGTLVSDVETSDANLTYTIVSGPTHGSLTGAGQNKTYAPAANYNGSDSFTYSVTDRGDPDNCGAVVANVCTAALTSTTRTVSITVNAVDDAPVAVDDAKTVLEDAAATTITVLANDTDIDGGPKTIASATQPAHGAVVVAADNLSLTYLPAANYCNDGSPTDDFTYTLNGGSTATVRVTVTCVDDAPVAVDDAKTVLEDAAATTITVLANDTDIDGGPKTIASATQPAHGAVVVAADNLSLTYLPAANYCNDGSPTDDFTYTLNGGSTATVRVTVTCVDDAPVAVDDAKTVLEDAAATTITVLANDTDIDGGPKTIASATQPAHGAVVVAADNLSLTYLPAANYCNDGSPTDDFTYTLNGGSTATVRVTVTCVDDAPVAVDDAKTVLEDAAATTITVLANDTDIDGGPKTIASATQPAHGAVVVAADNLSLTYLPAANYCNDGSPTDDFTYTLNGGSTATVRVTVTCVDDAPVAVDDAKTVLEDAAATTITVLANDTDIDGGPKTIASATQPAHGAVVVAADNLSLTYLPAANYCNDGSPTDDFTYTLNGGSTATVRVTVTCVNDAPAGTDGSVTILEDGSHTFSAANFGFTDPLDSPANAFASVVITTAPVTGSLELNGSAVADGDEIVVADLGDLVFSPAANANGTPYTSLTFQVRDNGGIADGGVDLDQTANTFTINVTPVNDAPAGTDGSVTILEDGSHTFSAANFGFTDPLDSPANAFASVVITTAPVTGSLELNGSAVADGDEIVVADLGDLVFSPAANANGTPYASLTFQVRDNGGTLNGGHDTSATQSFVIDVTPVNDAPSFTKGLDQTVLEDAGAQTVNPWATGISAGPANESGQTVSFEITGNTNPVLFSTGPSVSPSGVLTYTPAANANGSATITLRITDNGGTLNGGHDTSVTQSFVIDVTPVNDAPSFTKGLDQTVLEDAGAQTVNPWATGISAGPANESGQTVSFEITGNTNPVLFSTGPSVSPSGVLTYTPAANANGSATITLRITDNGGTLNGGHDTSVTQSFVIDVTPVNDAPEVTLAGTFTEVDEGTTRTFTYIVVDVDGDTPSVTEACGSNATYLPDVTANSFACKFIDGPGSSTVKVTANDGHPPTNIGSDERSINVLNLAPTISSAAITVDSVTGNISSTMTYSDAGVSDTQTATFEYRLNGLLVATDTSAPTLASSGTATDSYHAAPGCYSVEVTMWVTDKDHASSTHVVRTGATSTVDIYTASFKAPIKDNERNIAKYGNVVPIKVELASSCAAGTTITTPTLFITIAAGNVTDMDPDATPVIVAESVSSADSGSQMRVNGGGYIYNFATKTLTQGQDYTIRIRVGGITGPIILRALFQPKK